MKIRKKSGMMQAVIILTVCLYLVSCASVPASKTVPVPEMVLINGGTFMMGTPPDEKDRYENEGPLHEVTLAAFYMGKYEVTQEEYAAVMGPHHSTIDGDNLPVDRVSWYDAVEYCNALSALEGLPQVYTIHGEDVQCNWSSDGYRLPTEAEWEYAYRAGTETMYYWGDTITPENANYNNEKGPVLVPGGRYPPNNFCLYDMSGNVYEFCWNWWQDPYVPADNTNPHGPDGGTWRTTRGGYWGSPGHVLRSGRRDNAFLNRQSEGNGFRVARNAGPGHR
jgi:formylglycine-generating enzyme required for sulfatase activity